MCWRCCCMSRNAIMPSLQVSAIALIAAALLAVWPGTGTADPAEDDATAAKLDPDYAAGKQAIDAKDWPAAIKLLNSAALRDTRNADIQTYLGYAYRHAGQFDLA